MDDNSDQDDSVCVTRSGKASKPHNYSKHFPETSHTQKGTIDGRWLKLYYYDEVEMIEHWVMESSITNHTSLKMWLKKR